MSSKVIITLKEILTARGIEQKELAEMTGLTTRTISELCTNKIERIPKSAIAKIADALEIEDIGAILRIEKDA